MYDLIDGIKAKGSGSILLRHLKRIVSVLAFSLLGAVGFGLLMDKPILSLFSHELLGVMIAIFLILVIDMLREIVKNGE